MKGKRGEETIDNPISLIIGVAMLIALIFLLYALFANGFDRGEETAKNYAKQLEEKLKEADRGMVAEMEILPMSKQGVVIYIIYFNNQLAETIKKGGNDHLFFNPDASPNHLSVCFSEFEEESKCVYLPQRIPSELEGSEEAKWNIGEGERFTITLEENPTRYVFRKK